MRSIIVCITPRDPSTMANCDWIGWKVSKTLVLSINTQLFWSYTSKKTNQFSIIFACDSYCTSLIFKCCILESSIATELWNTSQNMGLKFIQNNNELFTKVLSDQITFFCYYDAIFLVILQ